MGKSIQFLSLVLFIICVSIASARFTGSKLKPRIVGGYSAGQGEFPYQVSIRTKSRNKHCCGGAIISSNYILTAAHCFFSRANVALFYAVVGTYHIDEQGVRVELSHLKVHENFNAKLTQNDIALFRSAESIPFSELVQPIAMPTNGDIPSGTKVIVSGWGLVSEPLDAHELMFYAARPTSLQFLETVTVDLDECKRLFDRLKDADPVDYRSSIDSLTEGNICAKNERSTGGCIGDSGGPLVSNETLIGLVSWSVGCAGGYPDVYTKVFAQLNWIHQTMNTLDSSS